MPKRKKRLITTEDLCRFQYVTDCQISPDGKQFVCNFRKKDKEALEREADEQKKELGVVERHITRLTYKADAYGFLPKERCTPQAFAAYFR